MFDHVYIVAGITKLFRPRFKKTLVLVEAPLKHNRRIDFKNLP